MTELLTNVYLKIKYNKIGKKQGLTFSPTPEQEARIKKQFDVELGTNKKWELDVESNIILSKYCNPFPIPLCL